ncbi:MULTISPECIES: hypothetical protein [Priestia]|uniref:hypothetical protein n=1 Tax=Priestia TaxID=2800373 RepID=UPI001374DD52|nr:MULTISPECIES: hypothetical protein [Priestia]MCM3772933.1 hypothetical protein [Priestia aryabhattai]MDH3170142.1 hypothetical protein [Priestia megaterium]MDY0941674.1 hypothetical protein [Priestia megaterium]
MNQVLFEQLLEGNVEYEDVPEDTNIELTDEQRHEMRLWLVGAYDFSDRAAKSYID